MTSHRIRPALAAIVLAGALVACGSDDQGSTASVSTAGTSSPTSIEPPPNANPTEGPVEILGVYESVEFYPACGNETLDHQGSTWYPLINATYDAPDPELQERADLVLDVDRETSPVTGRQGLVRVVAPGPGDDVGTLVVWADGVARWVSESRDLDVWMINDEITYNFVC